MTHTYTYSYAVLELSPQAYNEIKQKLVEAEYKGAFYDHPEHGLIIDMHGIAVAKKLTRREKVKRKRRAVPSE